MSPDRQMHGQVEYDVLPVKRKEILTPATTWMGLEDTALSETSRSQRTHAV